MASRWDGPLKRLDTQSLRKAFGQVRSRTGEELGRLRGTARDLAGTSVVAHALAAKERGNFEAAFWLLNEAYGANESDTEVAVHYWNVALELGRVDIASPAAVRLIVTNAHAGEVDLAAQFWLELIGAAPDVLIPSEAIAAILPALKKRHAEADEEQRDALRGPLRRAMRHAVDPRNGTLHPGVALRLFEEGRSVNPEAARRAAEIALQSPNLNEVKRQRLEQALTPESASRFEVLAGTPVDLRQDAIVLRDEQGRDLLLAYKEIEAMAAAEVAGLAAEPVVVIDLVCLARGNNDSAQQRRVARMRSDAFDPSSLVEHCIPGDELAGFLGELLERCQCTALPSLESALGIQLTQFESLADYEREVLSVA